MRRSLLLALGGAVLMLLVGVSYGFAGHERALTKERNELSHNAVEQAQQLDAYFTRARSIALLTANNLAFRQFYAEGGDRAARIRRGGPVVDAVNQALQFLEQLYPGRIGEACFIDAGGAENARTVRGERASYADLSPDETKSPMFTPSFALARDQVYQAKPYVSPDTDDWVISNSTPVVLADESKPAIVHYEISVDSFRREAIARSETEVLVVGAGTGQVILDSLRPQQIGGPLGDPSDTRFRGLVGHWTDAGSIRLDGLQAAYKRVAGGTGNANNWYVISLADAASGPLTGIGALTVILVIASIGLIVFLLALLRRGQSALVSAAYTDALTGLHNRRRLVADLDNEIGAASKADPLLLILCDLNGFKVYNDTFGHPAGDALLARLGTALMGAMAGRGRAYRIGGDEFCVLARPKRSGTVEQLIQNVTGALSEHGEGFSITASHGAVLLPADASSATEAMRLVDLRMYENKNSGRVPADAQTTNALLRAIHERDPEWAERLSATSDLAGRVCQELGVPPAEETCIRLGARLHDVGKVAVPDEILRKPGPLSAAEWEFVRQAPSIGERITAAAPALAQVAPLVRAAREHYDGTGYPDGLSGEEIPMGARIVAACAALVAMTSDRPYAPRMDNGAALDELGRGAGSQFDPRVVRALRQAALQPAGESGQRRPGER